MRASPRSSNTRIRPAAALAQRGADHCSPPRRYMATVLLAALSLLAPAPAAAGGGPKRNVLYVVFDDLRPDLSMYTRGAPTVRTPHLQRLAAGGLV